MEILGAINKGWIPESADRDTSGVPGYKVIALPWILTNTSYWFMFDSKRGLSPRYGFQYKEAQDVTLEGPNKVFKTSEIQYRGSVIFDIGHNDPRYWIGSQNDNG